MAKKLNRTITETDEFGNIRISTSQVDITKKSDHRFLFLLTDTLYMFQNVSSLLDMKVFIFLSSMSEYNKGYVELPSTRRRELLDSLGTTNPNFSNSLARLKKIKMIAGEKGRFYVNPLIHWKGELSERDKLLKSRGKEIFEMFGYSPDEIKFLNQKYKFLKPTDSIEQAKVVEAVSISEIQEVIVVKPVEIKNEEPNNNFEVF